jgi:hypothetical protein
MLLRMLAGGDLAKQTAQYTVKAGVLSPNGQGCHPPTAACCNCLQHGGSAVDLLTCRATAVDVGYMSSLAGSIVLLLA